MLFPNTSPKSGASPPPTNGSPPKMASWIKVYEALGFVGTADAGKEVIGRCLLCGKDNHFYVSSTTGLWSCKRCGESGNTTQLLTALWKKWQADYPVGGWIDRIANHRHLDAALLEQTGIAFNGDEFWIPQFAANGKSVVNFQHFALMDKIKLIWLPNPLGAGLMGLETIKASTKRIYLVEGIWDAIAARQMLRDAGETDYAVLAVPGAGNWKNSFNSICQGKEVWIAFDNDDAGIKGTKKLCTALAGVTSKTYHLVWHDELPKGYDLRDWQIDTGALPPGLRWPELKPFFTDIDPNGTAQASHVAPSASRDFNAVVDVFRKHLDMTDEHIAMLRVSTAVVLSTRLNGTPAWLYLEGPPGFGKSEVLMSLSEYSGVHTESSVTAASLISGWSQNNSKDPSLIPKLIGKCFVLKDFTEILQKAPTEREEVYNILRGAHDGEAKRPFGNGTARAFQGYFTMLAGVTQAIDKEPQSNMGDRFLRFRLRKPMESVIMRIARRAIDNIPTELEAKKELKEAMAAFLEHDSLLVPEIPQGYLEQLTYLSKTVATLRTVVERDKYTRQRVYFVPDPEMPGRLAKQLTKVLYGLGMIREPQKVEPEDMRLVVRIALDTCIPYYLRIVFALLKRSPLTSGEIAVEMNLPLLTIQEVLDDLKLIGAVVPVQTIKAERRWGLSPELKIGWDAAVSGWL